MPCQVVEANVVVGTTFSPATVVAVTVPPLVPRVVPLMFIPDVPSALALEVEFDDPLASALVFPELPHPATSTTAAASAITVPPTLH